MTDKPAAPKALADAGATLWVDVVGKYDLRADELRVLEAACKTTDKIAMLEKAWSDLGRPYLTKGSMGQDVIHPLIGEQRAQNSALASLLKQLSLPDDASIGGANQHRSAAQSRWASRGAGA